MPDLPERQPPFAYSSFIRVAGWIAPRRRRAGWRAKWSSGLRNWWILAERGEVSKRDLARLSTQALAEAFWLRLSRESLRRFVYGPAFVAAIAMAALLLAAIATRGFRATRALFEPPPAENAGGLVAIRYTGSANEPSGVPPRLVPLWREKSTLLADLAGFWYDSHRARVTTNFFSLMGAKPALGRTFQPGDAHVAVLSGHAWRTMFGGDPAILGRSIPLGRRQYTVIGVLPEGFWAISRGIMVWTPLILEPKPDPDTPFLIGAVGRLKPGASGTALRHELVALAREADYLLPRPPEVATFNAVPARPLFGYLVVIGFAVAVGLVLVAIGRQQVRRQGWRFWGFFAWKTLAIGVILPLVWVETAAAVATRISDTALRTVVSGLIPALIFIVGYGMALWWSFADQRRRCPVCLQRLAMPVTIGSWASVFEPVTTEFLCEEGHGSLSVPESEGGEPDRWREMDPSWRDLFDKRPGPEE